MQQREKTGSTSACGKGAKKDEAAKLTFHKDQVSEFTMKATRVKNCRKRRRTRTGMDIERVGSSFEKWSWSTKAAGQRWRNHQATKALAVASMRMRAFWEALWASLGSHPQAIVRRHKLGRSSSSALRVVMMESISLAISSSLVKRALSLMLVRIHLSISVLVAFVGALSSNTGR